MKNTKQINYFFIVSKAITNKLFFLKEKNIGINYYINKKGYASISQSL